MRTTNFVLLSLCVVTLSCSKTTVGVITVKNDISQDIRIELILPKGNIVREIPCDGGYHHLIQTATFNGYLDDFTLKDFVSDQAISKANLYLEEQEEPALCWRASEAKEQERNIFNLSQMRKHKEIDVDGTHFIVYEYIIYKEDIIYNYR